MLGAQLCRAVPHYRSTSFVMRLSKLKLRRLDPIAQDHLSCSCFESITVEVRRFVKPHCF